MLSLAAEAVSPKKEKPIGHFDSAIHFDMSTRGTPGTEHEQDTDVATETRTTPKLQKPKLYKVLLHNDDYTTMEFVVAVPMEVFRKSAADAHAIMLHVHLRGAGVAGVYPHEVAEAKVEKTIALARAAEYPLLATMEPE